MDRRRGCSIDVRGRPMMDHLAGCSMKSGERAMMNQFRGCSIKRGHTILLNYYVWRISWYIRVYKGSCLHRQNQSIHSYSLCLNSAFNRYYTMSIIWFVFLRTLHSIHWRCKNCPRECGLVVWMNAVFSWRFRVVDRARELEMPTRRSSTIELDRMQFCKFSRFPPMDSSPRIQCTLQLIRECEKFEKETDSQSSVWL
jgi:hypothetical protein